MSKSFVFKSLHIIAWIIFVGLCIEAGGLIVNFVYSLFKPDVIENLYQKLNLSSMYQQSKWAYFSMYSFAIYIAVLKAVLFYIVIELIQKLDLSKPFSSYAAKKITQISYYTFSIGISSLIAQQAAKNLSKHGYDIDKLGQFWADSQAFILMAAVIYVIATIFQKGVDIQNENDLTI
ncbi:MAG: DUF2975 domain-containing protein [Clostridia bacterium]|nr:DUF2975 domain-containing protein [Clostridia bacterium]